MSYSRKKYNYRDLREKAKRLNIKNRSKLSSNELRKLFEDIDKGKIRLEDVTYKKPKKTSTYYLIYLHLSPKNKQPLQYACYNGVKEYKDHINGFKSEETVGLVRVDEFSNDTKNAYVYVKSAYGNYSWKDLERNRNDKESKYFGIRVWGIDKGLRAEIGSGKIIYDN